MKKNQNRLTKELLETAKGMHKVGILDDTAYKKITKRQSKKKLLEMEPITSTDEAKTKDISNLAFLKSDYKEWCI